MVLVTAELVDCYKVETTVGHASVLSKGKTVNGLVVALVVIRRATCVEINQYIFTEQNAGWKWKYLYNFSNKNGCTMFYLCI